MQIESIIKRKGGTRASIGATEYHFKPIDPNDEKTPHVAEVSNKDHIQRFLAITDGYRVFQAGSEDDEAAIPEPPPAPADDNAQTPGQPETTTEMVGDDEAAPSDDGLDAGGIDQAEASQAQVGEEQSDEADTGGPVSDAVKAKLRSMESVDQIREWAQKANINVEVHPNMKPANAAERVIEAMEANGGDG